MIIQIAPYNSGWPIAFEREALNLKVILSDILVDIHHIGSTSVPGLMAKPIIDMIPEVSDLEKLDARSQQMEALGYEVMGEYGIVGRRYFRKGKNNRTHHVHAFLTGDPNIKRHIAFRDYLIAHQEVANAYGQLKWEIAQRCDNDSGRYCDEKDPFVKLHEQKALAWYEKRIM